ncbi:P-selectin-like [Physella acuta]|uniref:P-selectin-like n=1 Tax=Physella acuta TaxID=109671 RepID=UPI0027DB66D7|nr:P-selectin-like [Physella acuta]
MQCSSSFASIQNGKAYCQLEYGSECHYLCKEGFKLQGPEAVKCVDHDGGVAWEPNEKPSCVVDGCPRENVLNFANGMIYCVGAEQDYWIGSTCMYSCNLGYYLNGENNTVCQASATWSHPKPKCEVVECNEPPSVRGGMFNCTSTSPAYQTACELTCDAGYRLVGKTTITCMINAVWSDHGYCEECGGCKDDHSYTYLQNGEVNCQFDPTDGHRGLCSYYCHRGYEIHGQHVVNYHLDLGWNGRKPQCYPIRCPKFDVVNGEVICSYSNFFKSQCRVVCHRGFELSIPNITPLTCGEERQWSEAIPKCISKVCSKSYTLLMNGQVQCDGEVKNTHGSVCYYTCNQGFQLIGKDEIKCVENSDGRVQWSELVKPRCKKQEF